MKTVGSYWPYAAILFDLTRRAMPWQQPKSLTDDKVFAVSANMRRLNGIIGENHVMHATTLPSVVMPSPEGFILLYRNKKYPAASPEPTSRYGSCPSISYGVSPSRSGGRRTGTRSSVIRILFSGARRRIGSKEG